MFDLSNKKGLMFAFSTAIIWGLYTVLMKVGIVNFQLLHPVSFIFVIIYYWFVNSFSFSRSW